MVRAAMAELVRREVLTVSAEPLSPERGSYQSTQNMLRQVAYDTLSRRDRKARHLTVAAHLRTALPGDGEEVAEIIARHYLDALEAVPEDPDAEEIRGQAVAALIRAAERADRTGAPARPQRATPPRPSSPRRVPPAGRTQPPPCGNTPQTPPSPTPTSPPRSNAPTLPATAIFSPAIPGRPPAPRRSPGRRCAGGATTPRRVSSSPPRWRCCVQARMPTPSRALEELAALEIFAGAPDADRLTTEALALGQALAPRRPAHRPVYHPRGLPWDAGRHPQALAYFREAARLAAQATDNVRLGVVRSPRGGRLCYL